MSIIDKNKLFFGMLNYVFSEQQNVDWALKSSLVNFTGINSTVENKKYETEDLSDSIISYVKDVKPYHVQFEQYIEKYTSKNDVVKADVKDDLSIEYNIRFDAVTSEVDEQGNMTDLEYMDTHMANRLYFAKVKDKEAIKDYLNCHFKGLTVDGSTFNIDKTGYDVNTYDNKFYDTPTITYEYCLVSVGEYYGHEYEKYFIPVSTQIIKINDKYNLDKSNITITSTYNKKSKTITDYSIENNTITLLFNLRKYEIITIDYKKDGKKKSYIYVAHPFIESEANDQDVKKFISHTIRKFELPSNNVNSKIEVFIESPQGTRTLIHDYTVTDNVISLDTSSTSDSSSLDENWKVIINTIDYSYIYDKIYTWEDLYGRSDNRVLWENSGLSIQEKTKSQLIWDDLYENYYNIQFLDGENMLRPHYEEERPSELSVVYPLSHLMISKYNSKDELINIYDIDYKNKQQILVPKFNLITQPKLLEDFDIEDNSIHISNAGLFTLPETILGVLNPGLLLVNNEIIAFYKYELPDDGSIICKQLCRGWNGTFINEKIEKDTIVLSIPNDSKEIKPHLTSLSYKIKSDTENKFIIPGNFDANIEATVNEDKTVTENIITREIEVQKTSIINLLTPITFDSTYFDIDSNNVILPNDYHKGWLFIDDDKIYFDEITKITDSQYRITGFNIDKEYTTNSVIVSCVPNIVTNYTIKREKYYTKDFESKDEYNENVAQEYTKYSYYIVFDSMPSINETVSVLNRH